MAKIAMSLLVALSIISYVVMATARPGLPARRSRFLANHVVSLLPSYNCSKKSADVCLAPGSPGPTCCGGQCVDTIANTDHCGGCNKACKHSWTCCGGRCVDLLSDKMNCGSCSNQCNEKCNYGFCDYA